MKISYGVWILFIVLSLVSCAHATTSLVTDQDYFPTLLKELDHAEKSIDILSFSFAIDDGKGQIQSSGEAFLVAKRLADLKKEKGDALTIRLFIEGERSTVDRNKITGDFLEKTGVIVKYGSTHAKGFLIDHKRILFGSTNLTIQSMTKNNETNIVSDETKMIKGFSDFFENLWSDGAIGSVHLEKPMIADSAYKEAILQVIRSAKKSLDFSIYYFNDHDFEKELVAASERGVHVRGYLNQREIPGSNLVEKNRQTVSRMKALGLSDLHFAKDTSFTHSKYIIQDKKEVFLGTGNWNYSDVFNYRQLYVQLDDLQLAKELSLHLDEQIRTESDL